jgi:hypothetical protein
MTSASRVISSTPRRRYKRTGASQSSERLTELLRRVIHSVADHDDTASGSVPISCCRRSVGASMRVRLPLKRSLTRFQYDAPPGEFDQSNLNLGKLREEVPSLQPS